MCRERVNDRCNFTVGDAEKMEFPDNSFDIVFNSGTMSCLDLNKGLHEVCRVLKPDGIFLGIDTLGHNPILNLNRYLKYRRGERTKQTLNHVLRISDLERFNRFFGKTEFRYYDLLTFMVIPFEKLPYIRQVMLKLLGKVDGLLFHSFLKRYAFKVVFILSGPKKEM